jgi:hypothetical protein
MPAAVMVMVGGPDGTGVGDAGVVTGGVGAVGVAAGVLPEHAAAATKTMKREAIRITASRFDAEGAPGLE